MLLEPDTGLLDFKFMINGCIFPIQSLKTSFAQEVECPL